MKRCKYVLSSISTHFIYLHLFIDSDLGQNNEDPECGSNCDISDEETSVIDFNDCLSEVSSECEETVCDVTSKW